MFVRLVSAIKTKSPVGACEYMRLSLHHGPPLVARIFAMHCLDEIRVASSSFNGLLKMIRYVCNLMSPVYINTLDANTGFHSTYIALIATVQRAV